MNRRHAYRFAAAVLTFCTIVFTAAADVRPLSDAERAAVQFAAEYLAGGPRALVPRLSASSPLRAVGASRVEAEIETRLGPADDAKWQLVTVVEALQDKTAAFDISYPSGIEDTVFFDVVKEGDQFRISDVRMLAMPVARPPLFVEEKSAPERAIPGPRVDTYAALGGIVAAVLAFVAVFVMPFRRVTARVMFFSAFVLGLASVGMAGWKGSRFRVAPAIQPKVAAAPDAPQLAGLVNLRRALAAGGAGVGSALGELDPHSGTVADIAKLWRAQWHFVQGNLDEVDRALSSFETPSRTPLVEMLRARLALARNDSAGASAAYQRAISLGPGRDSLWLEATSVLAFAGFEAEARKELSRIARLGSREPAVYYATASLAADPESTDTMLQKAWSLEPAERSRLVSSGVIWSLMRRRGPTTINLSQPNEAIVMSPVASSRAVVFPAGAAAAISGELLHVAIGTAELFVPGGACLAPPGTRAVDAGQWSRAAEVRSLREAQALLASPPKLASFLQPALRERIASAAAALARRNRWSDVVTLTNGIDVRNEYVPEDVVFLRATSLQHLGRDPEAKRVLLDLAESPVLDRKKNASVYQQLGDMLASYDQFDRAASLFERSRSVSDGHYADLRLTQIAMDKRLATQYAVYTSPHFEIRYPPEVSEVMASGFARVLEGELQRLQQWISTPSFKPVVVNIVWWQDFKAVYTGGEDILGFYTGKITLPLAGIYDLSPEIVSLITHELAHAMLAQATNDQAPRWMQEGLAQRLEMVPFTPNAFNMYDDDKLLAVSVLDAVMSTSHDGDMVSAAYIVSQTFVRYLETSVGDQGMKNLIAQFARGATTEDAIAAVAGKPLADVDTAFRAWGRAENRVFANPPAVRYDQPAANEQHRERGSMGKGNFYPMLGKGQQ